MFPTFTAAVSDTHTENTNTILGVLYTFAGLGGVIGPWLMGWASDLFGLRTGFSTILLFTVIMLISLIILAKGEINEKDTKLGTSFNSSN
jgi:fucose permease